MAQRANIKRAAAMSVVLLVPIVFVMYQLYDYNLESMEPFNYEGKLDRKVKVDRLVYDLSVASDTRNQSMEFYFHMEHNDSNRSSIDVLYSEKEVKNVIRTIKEEAAKIMNLPQEKCERRLPQVLIIGNFKCGTRELIDYMSMHPRIVIRSAPYYEISFFDHQYGRGLEWYRKNMPCSLSNQITIEKSPSYFHSMDAPARIYQMNSSIKLIALVREPVDRIISWFTFQKNRIKHFNYNLDKCAFKQPSGDINIGCQAIRESIYDDGIKRYLSFFSQNQIQIIETERFKRNPYTVLREIEEFLNIEHAIKPDNFVYIEEKGVFCLRQNRGSNNASCYGHRRGRNTTQVKESITYSNLTLHRLKSFFKPHNEELFRLINKTFDW